MANAQADFVYAVNRLTLTFEDHEVEREYRRDFDEKNRSFYLLGIILSLVGWLSMIYNAHLHRPEHTTQVVLIVCAGLLPLFGFIIAIVATKRLIALYQPMCALANFLAGVAAIYIGHFLLESSTVTISFVVAVAFFCFFILRVRFNMAVVICTAYLLGFELVLTRPSHMPEAIVQSLLWGVPLLLTICVVGGYAMERSSRTLFVQERTIERQKQLLEAEHERSERLLLNILPPEIAARLKNKEESIADSYAEVSVLFCDIVDFTPLSAELPPEELVALLNEIFSLFDGLVDKYGLEKIKTIGDAYMAVAGVPKPTTDHASKIMRLAVDMLTEIETQNATTGRRIQLRIGISSGPVVAGVIGKKKFLFDLWGDTVNTASRMESGGVPGAIQVSAATHALLADAYSFQSRGQIDIKGKGQMSTYLYTLA